MRYPRLLAAMGAAALPPPEEVVPDRGRLRPGRPPALRLITCGGGYDEQSSNYRANVIVWARMVSAQRT